MKVRMRTLCAGPAGVRQAGSVYDVPEEEAAQLVAGGYAVAVHETAVVEEAVAAPAETAVAPGQRRNPPRQPRGRTGG